MPLPRQAIPVSKGPTLHGRVSAVLTAVIAILLILAALGWMHGTRASIREEVNAATRVAEQWLTVRIPETVSAGHANREKLLAQLSAIGRVRANQLEVFSADGTELYRSLEPTYKSGRFAPDWFALWLSPELETRLYPAGDLVVRLTPDTSRAVLDAWDQLRAAAGWGVAMLVFIFLSSKAALNRALAPINQINTALARGADGHFDTRLPIYPVAELDQLARNYNRLADTLDQSIARNAHLEESQAFTQAMQQRLEAERRLIARELHDELGQSITAVRAIAGAIRQRTTDQPGLHGSAQAILAMTGQMQDGVRNILQHLRPVEGDGDLSIEDAISNYCVLWSSRHPEISLQCDAETSAISSSAPLGRTLLRILQESLTNIARHANARHVSVSLQCRDESIVLRVIDDGRGLDSQAAPDRFGLTGMRERVSELNGKFELEIPANGGLAVCAHLPIAPAESP